MAILVTGGAGYIGSATVESLLLDGEEVVVIDDLVCGHRSAVPDGVPFYEGQVGDADLVGSILAEHQIDSCIHFAAYTYVGESVTDPAKYFENNTIQTNRLLNTLIAGNVKKFVFSSTCATYGVPVRVPINEEHPQKPINPYGWTKFMTERILESYDVAYGMKFVALRYFNAAGATESCGEHHEPETHLIPLVLRVAAGDLPHISVFGDDYDTPDGTCIRDYIHISDLANAHKKAMDHLNSDSSNFFNLGNGVGFSVLEVIDAARRITGREIPVRIEGRRAGDPARLIADSSKAAEVLKWSPKYTSIDPIIESAWNWMQSHPNGYEQVGPTIPSN